MRLKKLQCSMSVLAALATIATAGVAPARAATVIDNAKGLDVQDAPTLAEAQAATEREIVEMVAKAPVQTRVSLGEEMQRAVQIRHQASTLVRTVMQDARLGKAIELDHVQPVVQNITESILRNPGALVGLLRIKNKDDYTFLHSVSVCTLLVAFCRSRNMPADVIHQAGLGGLGERIDHRGSCLIERPLCQPGHPWGLRRHEVSHATERGENVVGSNGRGSVPHDQGQYRTVGVRIGGGRALRRQNCSTGVERAQAVLHEPLHDHLVGSQEGGHGRDGAVMGHPGQFDAPHAGLEPVDEVGSAGLHDVEDVEPLREGGVEGCPHRLGVAGGRDAQLDVLRLAGHSRGRRVRVGDLRMGVEAGAVGHRNLGPPQGPLEGPLEVARAGEPQPPALGVPQAKPLDGGGDVPIGCLTGHLRGSPGRRRRRAPSAWAG